MRLVSLTFLALCLPLAATVYRHLPARRRVGALLAFDLLFYGAAAGRTAWILPLLAVLTAIAARSSIPRSFAAMSAVGVLALCRIAGNVPMGMAFFVLRAVGFLLGTREKRPITETVCGLLFFPTVTMGPLTDEDTFAAGLRSLPSVGARADAVCRIAVGLAKKSVLADPLLVAYRAFLSHTTSLGALLTLLSFSLYLYFDFSGYSDIAVGVGGVFGFTLPENFDYPYMSRSVGDFFRRWHATLGRWLFRFVYLPLGGSRHGRWRTLLSLAAVWLCTALWHGATGCYLCWGAYFFLLISGEKLCLPRGARIGLLPTLCLVTLGWVFFFSADLASAFSFFGRLFCLGDTLLYSHADWYDALRYAPFLLFCMLAATPLLRTVSHRLCLRFGHVPRRVAALGCFVLSLAYVAADGYTPFLYASY